MLKYKLKTQKQLQYVDYKQAFLSRKSYTDIALQYVVFPKQVTIIHCLFFTVVKIQDI